MLFVINIFWNGFLFQLVSAHACYDFFSLMSEKSNHCIILLRLSYMGRVYSQLSFKWVSCQNKNASEVSAMTIDFQLGDCNAEYRLLLSVTKHNLSCQCLMRINYFYSAFGYMIPCFYVVSVMPYSFFITLYYILYYICIMYVSYIVCVLYYIYDLALSLSSNK